LRIVAVSGEGEALRALLVEDSETPIVYADVTPDKAQAARDADVAARTVSVSADETHVVDSKGIFR
jgi:hypothetical protein